MKFNIYDDCNLEDVLITVSHNYEMDEMYPTVIGHDIMIIRDHYIPLTGDQRKDILEHLDSYTLEGKPITEVSVHRYTVDVDDDGPVYQIEVVLYN